MALLLPESPELPRALFSPGLVKFSDHDKSILQKRLENDNNGNGGGSYGVHIPLKVVFRTISYYRRWPHFISTFVVFSTWSPLTTFTPSIIMYVFPAADIREIFRHMSRHNFRLDQEN